MSLVKHFEKRNSVATHNRIKSAAKAWFICLAATAVTAACDSSGSPPVDESGINHSTEIGSIISTRPSGDIRLPTAVSATGGLELLVNGRMGGWPGGWSACNNNSEPGLRAGNIVIPAGNCIQQLVSALPGDQLNFTCQIGLTPAPARWTGVGLSFYDQNRNFISEPNAALVNNTESREYSVAGTVPNNAAFALAWIYTASGAYSRSGDGCSLISSGGPSGPSDPINGNLLSNAEFDEVANGSSVNWTNYCRGSANVFNNQGDTGVELTDSACLTQSLNASKVSAIRGNNIRLSCTVERTSRRYAAIGTNLLTGQHSEQSIPQRDGRFEVSLSRRASADIVNGYVSVNGAVRVYDCALEIVDGQQQNQAPVATDDSYVFAAQNVVTNVTMDFLANDFDPEGGLDLDSVIITRQPAFGTIVTTFGRQLVYETRFPADVSFSYTIADGQGLRSNEATVSVSFTGTGLPNQSPPENEDRPRPKKIRITDGMDNPAVDGRVTGFEYTGGKVGAIPFVLEDSSNRPLDGGDFTVGQDGRFLYFRVTTVKPLVSDSNPVNGNLWEDDSFEIFFDLGNDTVTEGYDSNDFGRVYGFGKQGAPDIFTGQNSRASLTNVAQCNIQESGSDQISTCEVRFDLAEMGLTGSGDKELGFDLHLNLDYDGGVRDRKYSWCNSTTRPAWRDMSVIDCSIILLD